MGDGISTLLTGNVLTVSLGLQCFGYVIQFSAKRMMRCILFSIGKHALSGCNRSRNSFSCSPNGTVKLKGRGSTARWVLDASMVDSGRIELKLWISSWFDIETRKIVPGKSTPVSGSFVMFTKVSDSSLYYVS